MSQAALLFGENILRQAEANIREAIQFHIEGLKQEGFEIPEPSSYSSYVDVAA